ncbi:MAG: hypothetical protein AAFU77_17780 [Myxococcota bacterium]
MTTSVNGGAESEAVSVTLNELDVVATRGDASITHSITVTEDPVRFIKATNPDQGDEFGAAIALSRDTLAVGAPFEDSDGSNETDNSVADSGAVYIFRRVNGDWTFEAYLKANSPNQEDRFGASLSIDGDTLIVGAPGASLETDPSNTTSGSGAVYVFQRVGATWNQQDFLKPQTADDDDGFGASVGFSDGRIVIGAPGEDSAATRVDGTATSNSSPSSGAAYVFEFSGTSWVQRAYLKSSNSDSGDSFGGSVAIDGEVIVIGASGEDSAATEIDGDDGNTGTSVGAAYVFEMVSGDWQQTVYLKATSGQSGLVFGTSVCVAPDVIAVGMPGREVSGAPEQVGGVTIFQSEQNGWSRVGTRADNQLTAGFFQGRNVDCSNTRVVVSADRDGPDVYDFNGGSWSSFDLSSPRRSSSSDLFADNVALDGSSIVGGATREDSGASFAAPDPADNSVSASGAVYVIE